MCTVEAFSRMAPRLALILIIAATSCGCGRGSPPPPSVSPYMHSPPIKQLSREQLHALSTECEKYPESSTQRGPYDAAYCRDAVDAWSDAPLESVGVFGPAAVDQKPRSQPQ